MADTKKTCDLCRLTTDTNEDVILFGDWVGNSKLTLHYYCLLLSTNLPQKGRDFSGILGFLESDIRREICAAGMRECRYCNKMHASIACHKCKRYFHLVCGHLYDCVSQFSDTFPSYCGECKPLDEFKLNMMRDLPSRDERCYICKDRMDLYDPHKWVYAPCCGNGFVHNICMRKYALSAGYYLKCIWCKSSKFREVVRLQNVFVPDREAQWEREKTAYEDLHRGHRRCDMEKCLCPRGRDYIRGHWSLITCSLCGSFGAHNPKCIPGKGKLKNQLDEFKCETCSATEKSIVNIRSNRRLANLNPVSSMYITKNASDFCETLMQKVRNISVTEGDSSTSSSRETVVESTFYNCLKPSKSSADSSHFSGSVADKNSVSPVRFDMLPASKKTNDTFLVLDAKDEIRKSASSQKQSGCSGLATIQPTKETESGTTTSYTGRESTTELSSTETVIAAKNRESPASSANPPVHEQADNDVLLLNAIELNTNGEIVGMHQVGLDMSDTRFAGKTVEEIEQSFDTRIKPEDILFTYDHAAVFQQIDSIIAEYL